MIVKLLTEHHLEFLSLAGGCRGLSESTLVKMSNCWKSHVAAHVCILFLFRDPSDMRTAYSLNLPHIVGNLFSLVHEKSQDGDQTEKLCGLNSVTK